MKQAGRVALITGGNKGIGRQIGRELGRGGLTVLLGARSLARGDAAAGTLRAEGIDAHAIELDVTDEASVARAADRILGRFGSLDILVNNAGINDPGDGRPAHASVDAVRRLLETNFLGALAVTQSMLPLLRRGRSARIVNLSSSLGSLSLNGDPTSPYHQAQWIGYNASKAALNMLTVQLAQELGEHGIAVNAVCPGFVRTDLNGNTGVLTVEEGAATAVRLALTETGGTGQFLDARGQVPW